MNLQEELGRLADTAPRPTIDRTLWEQGRALRRRDRLVTSALVLAMVVILGGVAALVLSPQRTGDPADGPVPDGAIPSRIVDPATGSAPEKDFAIGQGSVAFMSSTGEPVVIGASDGRYHHLQWLEVTAPFALSLSPDGRRLAWASLTRLNVADLETGDVLTFPYNSGRGAQGTSLVWQADSSRVTWQGTNAVGEGVAGTVDLSGPSERLHPIERTLATGIASPAQALAALATTENQPSALFVRPARPGAGVDSDDEEKVRRALPVDLYPSGASVRPLGWAADDLLLAEVDAPAGSYVEGPHLALFTSPDRPESEWTYRIVMRDLPDVDVSIAVDLIPDLDGTSSQPLTHDFGEPEVPGDSPRRDRLPAILGGLAALLAGLAYIRMLRRQ